LTEKKRRGRPSKLTKEVQETAIDLAKKGKTEVQISEIIGVHPTTLSYWKGNYKQFSYALKEAKQDADDLVEASLFRKATGYYHTEEKVFLTRDGGVKRVETVKHTPPDTTAAIFWLKNRRPERWRESYQVSAEPVSITAIQIKTFEEFCETAGYPRPFPKQVEMKDFGLGTEGAHMILGSRGYGKTDYVVILGVAYEIYCEYLAGSPQSSNLLVTKSEERNAAMISEMVKAAEANGVIFEKVNSTCCRVKGLLGKDHTVSSITIGTKSVRGRHPKRIIMDDPVTEDDTSEATRRKVQKLYNELFKLCSNILIIGQPVHKYDLYMNIRDRIAKMEVPHGTIPELDHDLEAQRLAGVSEESIQASYYLKVVSENPSPFENVKFIDSFPIRDSVAFIDPSFEGGDYTALTILASHFDGVAIQGHVYKKAWNHCLSDMIETMVRHGVKRICFETNSLGDQPIILLRQNVPAGVGVVGKKSTGHKHSRIMNAGVFADLIHISKTSDRLYIEQVQKYEYNSKYDDAPDSLASALEWVGLIKGKR
jgi:hypothetical protein